MYVPPASRRRGSDQSADPAAAAAPGRAEARAVSAAGDEGWARA